jgi:hypothetical protein
MISNITERSNDRVRQGLQDVNGSISAAATVTAFFSQLFTFSYNNHDGNMNNRNDDTTATTNGKVDLKVTHDKSSSSSDSSSPALHRC